MKGFCCFVAWEWINIALEYAATVWVKLPRWFIAVVCVNLATHPVFSFALDVFGRSASFVLMCESAIVCVEALLLMVIYGFNRWKCFLCVSFVMNMVSYLTGVLILGA